ncbi:gene transfer agent family protein [Maricaulis sp. CAU 1757]
MSGAGMANPVRGEIAVAAGGQSGVLCLTLGALAQVEALMADGARLDAGRLVAVTRILLRAGGTSAEAAEVLAGALTPSEAAEAVARCFASAGP